MLQFIQYGLHNSFPGGKLPVFSVYESMVHVDSLQTAQKRKVIFLMGPAEIMIIQIFISHRNWLKMGSWLRVQLHHHFHHHFSVIQCSFRGDAMSFFPVYSICLVCLPMFQPPWWTFRLQSVMSAHYLFCLPLFFPELAPWRISLIRLLSLITWLYHYKFSYPRWIWRHLRTSCLSANVSSCVFCLVVLFLFVEQMLNRWWLYNRLLRSVLFVNKSQSFFDALC